MAPRERRLGIQQVLPDVLHAGTNAGTMGGAIGENHHSRARLRIEPNKGSVAQRCSVVTSKRGPTGELPGSPERTESAALRFLRI